MAADVLVTIVASSNGIDQDFSDLSNISVDWMSSVLILMGMKQDH